MNGVFAEWLEEDRLIGIIRTSSADDAVAAAHDLVDGGVRLMEFSLSGGGALSAIEQSAGAHASRVLIGAGTVLSVKQASEALKAGAGFLVSPTLVPEVVKWAAERDVPAIPGAMTPSEIWDAHTAGAAFIKVFPAGSLGPSYIRALLNPFPHLRLVPTGGVTLSDAHDYIRAGATAVAVAGALTHPVEGGDGLARRAQELLRRLRAVRDLDAA